MWCHRPVNPALGSKAERRMVSSRPSQKRNRGGRQRQKTWGGSRRNVSSLLSGEGSWLRDAGWPLSAPSSPFWHVFSRLLVSSMSMGLMTVSRHRVRPEGWCLGGHLSCSGRGLSGSLLMDPWWSESAVDCGVCVFLSAHLSTVSIQPRGSYLVFRQGYDRFLRDRDRSLACCYIPASSATQRKAGLGYGRLRSACEAPAVVE